MRSRTAFAAASARRKKRIATNNGGSMPDRAIEPKRPPLLIVVEDLFGTVPARRMPKARYGQFPAGLIEKLLPWLRCARHEILHICSGSLPPGEGIRVDISSDAAPDYIADGRALPRDIFPDGSVKAVMLDPPYNEHYAEDLYGVEYPRPAHLLAEAARVVRPGGRIVIVHYITPTPPRGTTFVKSFGLSTGFNYPIRAITIYERNQRGLALGGGEP